MSSEGFITDPMLDRMGVAHGFGTRGARAPEGCLRARQVHGVTVAHLGESGGAEPEEADAFVCDRPLVPIAVVTADCVPILLATASGSVVAAVHAGWRGLSAGVIEAAVGAVRSKTRESIRAAVGPHIRACCYEVDSPVIVPLEQRFGEEAVRAAVSDSRPGHHWIELQDLVVRDLHRSGVVPSDIGVAAAHCTACDAGRFESFRRDGSAAGRLVHWVSARRLS